MALTIKRFEIISKALGDPNRIKILKAVKDQASIQCTDIFEMISLSQPAISHHTKVLIEAGLLIPEKQGRNYKYTLDKEVLGEYMNFLAEIKG